MEINEQKIKKADLIYYPNKILRTNCKEIHEKYFNTPILDQLCDVMKKIAIRHDGVGLAAPQIGINARIIFIAPTKKKYFFLINPEIVQKSDRKILDTEGCLSLPEIFGTVIRHDNIIIKAFDTSGNRIEIEAKDIVSRIIQHEVDHLNGILFIDKMITITSGQEKLESLQNLR